MVLFCVCVLACVLVLLNSVVVRHLFTWFLLPGVLVAYCIFVVVVCLVFAGGWSWVWCLVFWCEL